MSTVDVEQALRLPVEKRGEALARLPEDQWFDRKSPRVAARDLADAEIGFANAEGGIIVIGIWDGKVLGIGSSPKQVNEWQQAALRFSTPPAPARLRLVECIDYRQNKNRITVIEVETSTLVHANHRDEVFLRVGDENRKLNFAQRQELLYDKGQSSFEGTLVHGVRLGEELDEEVLDSYAEAVGHPDPIRLLKARGLVTRKDELTVGGLLLFGKTPQAHMPGADIRVLRYAGTSRGSGARQQLLQDSRYEGSIPRILTKSRRRIFELLPTRVALTTRGRFERVGLVPQDAWLEGLVNAAVHRSYSIMGDHIRVEIFDDRIEIESPGRFPGIVDFSDPLTVTRFARNPRIARVCADLHFGQELGEGIRRMFEEMRLAGLADPEYRQTAGSVRLILSSAPVDRHLEARLPIGARGLVRFIREAGRASTGDLVAATNRSRPVVLRQLRALHEAGIIEWIGNSPKDPRAYWQLKID